MQRSPKDVSKRLDSLIADIRSRYHEKAMGKSAEEGQPSDVLLVAHGHILRAFAMRWIGRQLTNGVSLLLEGNVNNSDHRPAKCIDSNVAGGVGTLRYAHGIIACLKLLTQIAATSIIRSMNPLSCMSEQFLCAQKVY